MKRFFSKPWRIAALALLAVIIGAGFVLPEARKIPVSGATTNDWNHNTFWYEPWGSSGVHKGIDIFANKNTPVIATNDLLVLYTGELSKGGNVVLGLGPKWRFHYYAHLAAVEPVGFIVSAGDKIGSVGDTGNAAGKPAHLHYSIVSLFPMVWHIDSSTQGYKKAFFLNPDQYFRSAD